MSRLRDGHPDGPGAELAATLRSVAARLRRGHLFRGATIGVGVGAPLGVALARSDASAGVVAVALAAAVTGSTAIWMRARRHAWTLQQAALRLERAHPASRNVIVTAQELLEHPERASAWMRSHVIADAEALAGRTAVPHVVPLKSPVITLAVACGAMIGLLALAPPRAPRFAESAGPAEIQSPRTVPTSSTIVATITPPAYLEAEPHTVTNPERLEGLEGSLLRLVVTGGAARIRFSGGPVQTDDTNEGATAELILSDSGYFVVETGRVDRRLVPVVVTRDRVPAVRVEKPAKDLVMSDPSTSIPIAASATDDHGLESLELRYTKVSGSGEQFEFVEGTLPLTVTRDGRRAWKASGQLALSRLQVVPGDSLVYRVVARDRRPGDAGFASSETYFVEVAGPGQAAFAAFELPPEEERYALSQQMILLKVERLRAREKSTPRQTVEEEAAGIAAEQRAVRANFIFLLGGHVEDEEEEAEREHEIQEGRLENTARTEINAAIKFMSRTEQALVAIDTGNAIPAARSAVAALQRAFGRNRYLLRAMPERSRIDPARRLSGRLTEASNWRRTADMPALDTQVQEARAILARLLDVAGGASTDPAAIGALAERALAVDSENRVWQDVSRSLSKAHDALAAGQPDQDGTAYIREAAVALLPLARDPAGSLRLHQGSALESAWTDEIRR